MTLNFIELYLNIVPCQKIKLQVYKIFITKALLCYNAKKVALHKGRLR